MADTLKRLVHANAFQTSGGGLTASSNTGGIFSGGKMASLYTAPALTQVVVRYITAVCYLGVSPAGTDTDVTLFYRLGPTVWQHFHDTPAYTISGDGYHDSTVYSLAPGETIDVFILPAPYSNTPTPNASNTNNMYENWYIEIHGVEST